MVGSQGVSFWVYLGTHAWCVSYLVCPEALMNGGKISVRLVVSSSTLE